MSHNAKNLAYEAKEPAFLQRMKSQFGDTSSRLERPIARPRKQREDNDDDEPTYVDEESNEVISKEEYAALVRDSDGKGDQNPEKESVDQDEQRKSQPDGENKAPVPQKNLAEIGGTKKRKQAKVIGEENPPENPENDEAKREAPAARKPKLKKKKIKLSFDDAEA